MVRDQYTKMGFLYNAKLSRLFSNGRTTKILYGDNDEIQLLVLYT